MFQLDELVDRLGTPPDELLEDWLRQIRDLENAPDEHSVTSFSQGSDNLSVSRPLQSIRVSAAGMLSGLDDLSPSERVAVGSALRNLRAKREQRLTSNEIVTSVVTQPSTTTSLAKPANSHSTSAFAASTSSSLRTDKRADRKRPARFSRTQITLIGVGLVTLVSVIVWSASNVVSPSTGDSPLAARPSNNVADASASSANFPTSNAGGITSDAEPSGTPEIESPHSHAERNDQNAPQPQLLSSADVITSPITTTAAIEQSSNPLLRYEPPQSLSMGEAATSSKPTGSAMTTTDSVAETTDVTTQPMTSGTDAAQADRQGEWEKSLFAAMPTINLSMKGDVATDAEQSKSADEENSADAKNDSTATDDESALNASEFTKLPAAILELDRSVQTLGYPKSFHASPRHPQWKVRIEGPSDFTTEPAETQLINEQAGGAWLVTDPDADSPRAQLVLHAQLKPGRSGGLVWQVIGTAEDCPYLRLPVDRASLDVVSQTAKKWTTELRTLEDAAANDPSLLRRMGLSRTELTRRQRILSRIQEITAELDRMRILLGGELRAHAALEEQSTNQLRLRFGEPDGPP
ncbi:MAG: hypothetical protein U0892_21475 [Pirellulales bacterium]